MPKIVTLKDNNDDIVYPITPIDAVFTDTSVTLENMIDAKADTDLTNVVNGSVTTNKIADSAVTSDKIDWSTSSLETISPANYITLNSGYEFNTDYCDIRKFGKLIIARIQVHKTSGAFTTSTEVIGSMVSAYRPAGTINYGGFVGGEYNVSDSAYFYINGGSSTGNVSVRAASTSNNTFFKTMLIYAIRN